MMEEGGRREGGARYEKCSEVVFMASWRFKDLITVCRPETERIDAGGCR